MSMSGYSARKISVDGFEVVRLTDSAHHAEVSIAPAIGNIAYEFKIGGNDALYWPYASLADFKAKPGLSGIPFLAPWANRLDHDGFWANGKQYILKPDLGNIRRDAFGQPIHGLISFSNEWRVVNLHNDAKGAEVTSRLEFWKDPNLMAQFPFAHTIDMTYRLADGILEVRTAIENRSADPMPLCIGFHPYYRISDAPRDQWRVHIPAREHYELSSKLIPTGATTPNTLPDPVPLAGRQLDDVFGSVDHDDQFWVQGARQKISIRYGAKFPVAVVYAPAGKDFICFEPMTAVTDAFNLAHSGAYSALQSIPPGAKWQESFWIQPSGF